MSLLFAAIHNRLIDLARDGVFTSVAFNREDRSASDVERVHPESIAAGLARSNFKISENKSKYQRERESMRWQLVLQFSTNVSLEAFEDFLTEPEQCVIGGGSTGLPFCFVDLMSVGYEYAPRQGQGGGTRATFEFDVRPKRK